MKKGYFSSLFICISFWSFGQIVNIPDANFKNKLIEQGVDFNNDGEIQESEAVEVYSLNLSSSSISSLEGLQYFSTLSFLDCSNNLLTDLDLCGTAVYFIICDNNPNLTTISIKNNTVSMLLLGDPPLNPLSFFSLPNLQSICYDEGELEAIQFSLDTQNLNLSTSCHANCTSLNIQNQEETVNVALIPNPVTNTVNINVASGVNLQSITIYNTLGQLVKTVAGSEMISSSSIDVSDLKTGTYFMECNADFGAIRKKLIKN